jgi:hypothetical protein
MHASQNQSGTASKGQTAVNGFETANDRASRLLFLAVFAEKLNAEPVAEEARRTSRDWFRSRKRYCLFFFCDFKPFLFAARLLASAACWQLVLLVTSQA